MPTISKGDSQVRTYLPQQVLRSDGLVAQELGQSLKVADYLLAIIRNYLYHFVPPGAACLMKCANHRFLIRRYEQSFG